MNRKKIYRRFLIILFIAGVVFTGGYTYQFVDHSIPDEINVFSYDDIKLKTNLPVSYTVNKNSLEASTNQKDSRITPYKLKTKIFGIIPSKEVDVNVIKQTKVIPCGFQVGIYLHTQGVMVINTGEVSDLNGVISSPAQNIVKQDDYIVSLNGKDVNTKSQLIFLINKYGADDIVLGLRRNGNLLNVKVKPICSGTNEYKLGIWVRDDSQGIGTMTYLTEDGKFGLLGHGISDVDTGALLSSNNGILYRADIWGIKKGEAGTPGGLLGTIEYEKENEFGAITSNTEHGIFGVANDNLKNECGNDYMNIGLKQDVKKGKAYVRCAINNVIDDYEIEIIKVDYTNNQKTKGMIIKITDQRLLDYTNGIVQGMSGSPIIQDGKIIGAVTHVFVNNSTKGYGIFVENMLKDN